VISKQTVIKESKTMKTKKTISRRGSKRGHVNAVAALPLGAMMLAGGIGVNAWAQTTEAQGQTQGTLGTVTVREKAERQEGKDSIRAVETTIGKGKQALRDIPQSVTVVTEKLMDDRNLDTVKEALKQTAGITFLAAEGGEEDIRLRGFAVQQTGDMYVDGLRDPAIYDRDTFNFDRLEVLRGSASMLFGRGSTGGVVNQVMKQPRLLDQSQLDITLGNHNYLRVVGDFNVQTGDSAALRINTMVNKATNNGSGSSIDKRGVAVAYRNGIGERHELQANVYHLANDNGVNYGIPWLPTGTANGSPGTLVPIDPSNYYGLSSDYNKSGVTMVTLGHVYRPQADTELTTRARWSTFDRDLRSGALRWNSALSGGAVTTASYSPNSVLNRGTHLKIQDMQVGQFQSDLSHKFEAAGFKHHLLTGVDFANEKKSVDGDAPNLTGNPRTAYLTAMGLVKPTTSIGTPDDGASVNEANRILLLDTSYTSTSMGVYVQDTVSLTPVWKVVGGLRYDRMEGKYLDNTYTYTGPGYSSSNFAVTGVANYRVKISEVSKRLGVLYQPNELQSYYFSAGNSFNPSGDLYSLSSANENTPPEQSMNLELGGKIDSADKRVSTRVALFRSTKYNERNTDPLLFVPGTTTPVTALSGERHTAGVEFDLAGRITPRWEMYVSTMWMPIAKVDKAAPCPATGTCAQSAAGERPGDRPALTPKFSGTIWSTYQLNAAWRIGGGLNYRSKQNPTRTAWAVPSFTTADLMAEYRVGGGDKFIFKLNVNNVTNKLYADQLYPGHYIPGAGRLVQLTSSIKF
jgi:catecholate siderophore receptor